MTIQRLMITEEFKR